MLLLGDFMVIGDMPDINCLKPIVSKPKFLKIALCAAVHSTGAQVTSDEARENSLFVFPL